MHHYQDLITLFNHCFAASYNTRLVKGEEEPIYLPADNERPWHAIVFAHGFFSSALHECAHWLIAGAERRLQVDFGYWYVPDGRNEEQQQLFQQVEVKPQAMEWILSMAAGCRFRLSLDNLNGAPTDYQGFKEAVYQQALRYCRQGLPPRAARFRQALCEFYCTDVALDEQQFDCSAL
ncbi:diaminobutyrate-2-oxoglutarate aminotransferase [Legionella sp. MW5194]|uniref:elongation factor P hydroxylase n=1 Tax=Legionella sp. MW5194 TaxID=2662448 RepID=UPI001AF6AD15|nr:elongation factor P hydroxylase [Legionella sp. MW5194]QRN05132.1 diaminobutyrate-2-oxoglutarate aminotransferase [Legionella sp. MW5194]